MKTYTIEYILFNAKKEQIHEGSFPIQYSGHPDNIQALVAKYIISKHPDTRYYTITNCREAEPKTTVSLLLTGQSMGNKTYLVGYRLFGMDRVPISEGILRVRNKTSEAEAIIGAREYLKLTNPPAEYILISSCREEVPPIPQQDQQPIQININININVSSDKVTACSC